MNLLARSKAEYAGTKRRLTIQLLALNNDRLFRRVLLRPSFVIPGWESDAPQPHQMPRKVDISGSSIATSKCRAE
jgi:hypothetical protein